MVLFLIIKHDHISDVPFFSRDAPLMQGIKFYNPAAQIPNIVIDLHELRATIMIDSKTGNIELFYVHVRL